MACACEWECHLGRIIFLVSLCLTLDGCLDTNPSDPRVFTQDVDSTVITGGDGPDCPSALPSNDTDVERCLHTFVYRQLSTTRPDQIRLSGDLECPMPWAAAIPFVGPNEVGEWHLDLRIKPGIYRYKFVVDGQWIEDRENPAAEDDGQGGLNSLLTHACPAMPDCVFNSDCDQEARPICRSYECMACQCDNSEACNTATGECDPRPCQWNEECTEGQICADGLCRLCLEDTECGDGSICDVGRCQDAECDSWVDCEVGRDACRAHRCVESACTDQLFVLDAELGQYERVLLAGDFTDWLDGALPLVRLNDGRWGIQIPLNNGIFAYKFVTYGTADAQPEWITDPMASELVSDGVGGQNSIRRVQCESSDSMYGRCGDPAVSDWRDDVMYFVMTDRFFDSDGRSEPVVGATGGNAITGPSGQYEGGDLNGLSQKLSYLDGLGVSSLWISAPYKNRGIPGAAIDPATDPNLYSGYHGYWPSPANIDYSDPLTPQPIPSVEPRIGTSTDLHGVVDEAHQLGMKVLFDYVMNHVDVESPLYGAHPEWFVRGDGRDGRPADGFALCGPLNLWNDPYWGTRCAFTDYLPPFDFEQQAAREWSVADAVWWAREYDLDGFRLDAIKHVPDQWLLDLRVALNATFDAPTNGRFYLVGETFAYDDIGLLAHYIDPQVKLDGQFDFPLKARLCEGIFHGRMNELQQWMDEINRDAYPADAIMTTWVGNHDIPRAIHFASGEIADCREGSRPGHGWRHSPAQPSEVDAYERLGVAFGVLMTSPGIPLIYYGDEIGLAGGGDPDNRRMMPWDDDSLNSGQLHLRERLRSLISTRRTYRALSRGRRTTVSSDADHWSYRMACENEHHADLMVVVNRSDTPYLASSLPVGTYLDVENNEALISTNVEIAPRSIRILQKQE
jgi:glycosidase